MHIIKIHAPTETLELDFISTFDRIAVASDLLKIIDISIRKK
jgi:hypothetical protein